MRTCTQCFRIKELDQFNRHEASPEGRRLRCRDCTREYGKAYRKQNPAYLAQHDRAKNFKKYYGMTLEQYDHLKEWSNGGCCICGAAVAGKDGKRLHIDHCHETRQIRGLLCNGCNTGLGGFKDNIERLQRAIVYLQFFRSGPHPLGLGKYKEHPNRQ